MTSFPEPTSVERADVDAGADTPLGRFAGRVGLIAIGSGFVAGAVAALTFAAMKGVSWLVWQAPGLDGRRWYVAAVIIVGGVLIAVLRPFTDNGDLQSEIAAAEDPTGARRRRIGLVGLSAIIAVGFGGAIGPEAGLIAVVADLSSLVARRIARTSAEARLIGRSGVAGALAGLYVSPPGAAVYDDDSVGPTKLAVLVASVAGLVGFFVVLSALQIPHHPLVLPAYAPDRWGADAVMAIVPAVVAALLVLGVSWLHHRLTDLLGRAGGLRVQSAIGSALFALLAAAWPMLRFSGHETFDDVSAWVSSGRWDLLAWMIVLKPVAMVVCLAAGWRGGEFFPLMLTGACVGALTTAVLPLPLAAAMVAAMAAATAVGLRKPMAAGLIVVFLSGGAALVPTVVGLIVASIVIRRTTEPDAARADG